ncbi:MAG: glycosyltransferase family 2 protein [Nitrospinota bacterium]|nr:glycosyltransferase family 2 protein [Nitrospinota bacterium]
MSKPRQAFVCVIVVNHNSGQFLKTCVEALRRQAFTDFEVILVDNGSTDKSLDWAGPLPDNYRLMKNEENLGFSSACNAAAQMTQAEWIATLDADTCPDAHWLGNLMKAVGRHPSAVMFGSTLVNAERPDILDVSSKGYHAFGAPWRGDTGKPISKALPEGYTFSPSPTAGLFQREVFIKAGGFDERFFCYLEVTDLAYRLRLMGHVCIQAPDAVVLHLSSALSGGLYGPFAQFHVFRNRIWIYVKNTPLILLLVTFPFFLMTQGALIIRAVIFGFGGAALKGILAAISGIGPILASRAKIQSEATAGFMQIAGAMTWSPIKLITRGSDVRPI